MVDSIIPHVVDVHDRCQKLETFDMRPQDAGWDEHLLSEGHQNSNTGKHLTSESFEVLAITRVPPILKESFSQIISPRPRPCYFILGVGGWSQNSFGHVLRPLGSYLGPLRSETITYLKDHLSHPTRVGP